MKTPTRTGYHRISGPWQPSAAQQRVLGGVAAGESNPAIAQRLGLSAETVKWHVSELLAETGSADRAELAQWWQDRQQVQVGGLSYPWLLLLALAALLLIGLALATGLLVLFVAPGGARSHSLARRPTAVSTAAPTAPAEAAAPASSATPLPPDLPDPASSPSGSGPAVFLWQRPVDPGTSPNSPWWLALDSQGHLFLLDDFHDRVLELDSNGVIVRSWGGTGTADGQFTFRSPTAAYGLMGGIAVDAQDRVYVLDATYRVQLFDNTGVRRSGWTLPTQGPDSVQAGEGVAVDQQGNVYIADYLGNRIVVYDAQGDFLRAWGQTGSGPGEFTGVNQPVIDRQGTLYVGDDRNGRVQAFTTSGQFLRSWGSYGSGPGQLLTSGQVAVDSQGNLYIVNGYGNQVEKFDAQGSYLGAWGSAGSGDGQFSHAFGIGIDSQGDVYVGDRGNGRIEKFHPR
jgi:sugar lactone lactonase YvrE/DNA-binding CsgD family transcriptional regulator